MLSSWLHRCGRAAWVAALWLLMAAGAFSQPLHHAPRFTVQLASHPVPLGRLVDVAFDPTRAVTLEQVMQQLVRAGILKGVRGPRGGYRLARERRRISVGDVVRVAESIEDEEGKSVPRSDLGLRIVAPFVASLQDELMTRLDSVSIEDLCQRARGQTAPEIAGGGADYTI